MCWFQWGTSVRSRTNSCSPSDRQGDFFAWEVQLAYVMKLILSRRASKPCECPINLLGPRLCQRSTFQQVPYVLQRKRKHIMKTEYLQVHTPYILRTFSTDCGRRVQQPAGFQRLMSSQSGSFPEIPLGAQERNMLARSTALRSNPINQPTNQPNRLCQLGDNTS